jgi:hypothetical protein
VPAEAAGLYTLPLDEFTAARDAMAKQLKRDGDPGAAAAVKALRRPSNAAWALNQVANGEPDVVAAVLDAGAKLAAASDAADRAAIVEATKAERAAREAAGDAAMRALDAGGLTPGSSGVRQQVLDTLHAALVDDAVAAALRAGTLDKAYASTGFDFGGGRAVVVRSKPRPAPAPGRKLAAVKDPDARDAARAKAEAEEAERKEQLAREARARRAEEAERAAERAEELEREADDAEARALKARQLAVDARAEAQRLTDLVD